MQELLYWHFLFYCSQSSDKVKINLLKGRLGNHRFHMMLVHFPGALYPFTLLLDILWWITENPEFGFAARYSLIGAISMGVVAMIYGINDLVQIDPKSRAWKIAGIHALLNACWFVAYSSLLFYRMKHHDFSMGWSYLSIMSLTTAGLFYSNYLGAELVINHKVGISESES